MAKVYCGIILDSTVDADILNELHLSTDEFNALSDYIPPNYKSDAATIYKNTPWQNTPLYDNKTKQKIQAELPCRELTERNDKSTSSNVGEWNTWAFRDDLTEDDVREKCLTDYKHVCFAYLTETHHFREEFYDELMVLSTGLLNKKTYPIYFDALLNAIKIHNGMIKGEINTALLPMVRKTSKADPLTCLNDRLDWNKILSDKRFSPAFRRAHAMLTTKKNMSADEEIKNALKEVFAK